MKQILPGSVIGILGGGQLGRMIALKAREMGYWIAVLDPNPNSPCSQVADVEFTSALDDLGAARRMANISDVLTYEFENVNDELASSLEQEYYLPQGGKTLYTTRHRIREKMALEAAGIPVAPWRPVRLKEDLHAAVAELGVPSVLKTATGGYDGKGQYVIERLEDVEAAWTVLAGNFQPVGNGNVSIDELETAAASEAGIVRPEFVLEAWIEYDRELSVIAARNPNGETAIFPTAENIHRHNILHMSVVPARISTDMDRQAKELARQIVEKLDVIGLMAVEMFKQGDRLLVNELAPRPHNSGHYTMDACVTSQFEQHVRAICNLPLGDTALLTPVVMVNILGEHLVPVLNKAGLLGKGCKLHLYGKAEVVDKRKMGHLNVLAPTVEEALAVIEELAIWKEQQP